MIGKFSSSRLAKALLLLYAYLHPDQNTLIQENFEVKHIFPKKWQDTNYNGWSQTNAQIYLEKFGNKIVFEKTLNIQAGNNYFLQKKKRYSDSKIKIVLD